MNTKDRKSKLDYALSLILRIGLSLSIVIITYGAIRLLWEDGSEKVDYHIFDGLPASLRIFSTILVDAFSGNLLSIIQLGIIILIATPVVRVISCLVIFAAQRDFLYVVLSAIVLCLLLYANF